MSLTILPLLSLSIDPAWNKVLSGSRVFPSPPSLTPTCSIPQTRELLVPGAGAFIVWPVSRIVNIVIKVFMWPVTRIINRIINFILWPVSRMINRVINFQQAPTLPAQVFEFQIQSNTGGC